MLTATGLKRNELGSDGRKLVRHDGKQVLVIAQDGLQSAQRGSA